MNAFFELQSATLAARARTGDSAIGTCIKAGAIRVVRVTYPKGTRSVVEPLTGFLPIRKAIAYLDAMQ